METKFLFLTSWKQNFYFLPYGNRIFISCPMETGFLFLAPWKQDFYFLPYGNRIFVSYCKPHSTPILALGETSKSSKTRQNFEERAQKY